MTRTLSVWWDGLVVGTLQVNQHGQMLFTYDRDWLSDTSRSPISFSLPKQEQPFKQRQCRPFFAGLLPEETQRDVVAESSRRLQRQRLRIPRGPWRRCRGRAVALAGRRSAADAEPDGDAAVAERRRTGRSAGYASNASAARRPRGTPAFPCWRADQVADRSCRRPRGPTGARTADNAHPETGHIPALEHHRERGAGDDARRCSRAPSGARGGTDCGRAAVSTGHPLRPSIRRGRTGAPAASGGLLSGARHSARTKIRVRRRSHVQDWLRSAPPSDDAFRPARCLPSSTQRSST